jgi:hypothetical protein
MTTLPVAPVFVKNASLACQTLDYIREHPAEWDQHDYFCGTTACFAGRAILTGLGLPGVAAFRDWQEDQSRTTGCVPGTSEIACQLLGWNASEGEYVFGLMTRDFSVLERAVREVLNGEIRDDTEPGEN